jgi:hypothetical protein
MKGSDPIVVFPTDQSFPPFPLTDDYNCAIVIQMEDGRLFEIERAFKDIFSCSTKPHGKLPIGMVLIVSLSHLGCYKLESYSADLVITISAMGD